MEAQKRPLQNQELPSPSASANAPPPAKKPKERKSEDNSWTASVEGGLRRANAAAEKLLAARKAGTDTSDGAQLMSKVTELLLMLNGEWPTQTRPNVAPTTATNGGVRGMCLGLVYGLGGQGMKVSKVSESFPALTEFVNVAVAASLPVDPEAKEGKPFTWSSLQLNYNYAARKHVDGNNLGPSAIIALGEHTGGELWTENKGTLNATGQWCFFNGTKLHETQPFAGTRISVIAFTHNACDELTQGLAEDLRSLGFTAGGTDRQRDEGDVVETAFDALWATRLRDVPVRTCDGAVAVDVAGWACGRGACTILYRRAPAPKQKSLTSFFAVKPKPKPAASSSSSSSSSSKVEEERNYLPSNVDKIEMAKNTTGLHCVELRLDPNGSGGFQMVKQTRFQTYQDTEGAAKKFVEYVTALPKGRVLAIGIADSAIAKSRPLPEEVYEALRLMGAPDPTEVIGYRNPFCGIFVKGAAAGSAAFAICKHSQSKSIIRLEATVSRLTDERAAAVASSTAAAAAAAATGTSPPPSSSSSSSSPSSSSSTSSSASAAAGQQQQQQQQQLQKKKSKGPATDLPVELVDVTDRRVLVTDILGKPKALAKVGGKLVFADSDASAATQAAAAAIKAQSAGADSSSSSSSSSSISPDSSGSASVGAAPAAEKTTTATTDSDRPSGGDSTNDAME